MEVQVITNSDATVALNKSEIDIQIATAKAYPRDIKNSLEKIKILAMIDDETAEDCFYALRRTDKKGETVIIEGLSVRLAEIFASSWGNLRVATRIVANDGKKITAQSIAHDLESNYSVQIEVQRSILTSKGFTFSQDMQVVTGMAASARAFRNAVLKVIPSSVTKNIIKEVKNMAKGKSIDLPQRIQNMFAYYQQLGVSSEVLMAYLNVSKRDDITKDHVFEMNALKTAIKEGTTTVKETFFPETPKDVVDNKKEVIKSKQQKIQMP